MPDRLIAREDMFRWTLKVAGRDCGVWAESGGGAKSAEEGSAFPGGMEPEVALGGRASYENVSLTRQFDLLRDAELEPFLDAQVGVGEAVAIRQPLGRDGVPYGRPRTYVGILNGLTPPDHNSSGNDASTIAVEIKVASAV